MIARLSIPDVLLISIQRYGDHRGWFSETFSKVLAEQASLPSFVQDNESLSKMTGTVRGLHFQREPFAQAKLIRCVRGAVLDVAVDIRRSSPTFGEHVSMRLDAEKGEQLFLPTGFAHGFCTLEPDTLVQYKVDAPYSAAHEGGIIWNDPALGIVWPVAAADSILSGRDQLHPPLADAFL